MIKMKLCLRNNFWRYAHVCMHAHTHTKQNQSKITTARKNRWRYKDPRSTVILNDSLYGKGNGICSEHLFKASKKEVDDELNLTKSL